MRILVWLDKFCKGLITVAAIGLVLIIVMQLLLQIDVIRHQIVPVERWEGQITPFA